MVGSRVGSFLKSEDQLEGILNTLGTRMCFQTAERKQAKRKRLNVADDYLFSVIWPLPEVNSP